MDYDDTDTVELPAKDETMTAIHAEVPREYETTVVITNELGMHARPAAMVAQTAQLYAADVALLVAERQVDAKSILDILSLAAAKGTTLTVRGRGDDAEACVKAIADIVRGQFQEGSA